MAEFMTGLKRTDYCGDLRITDVGREVTVCGWVQRCRDLGQRSEERRVGKEWG